MPPLPGHSLLERRAVEVVGYTINCLSLIGCCFVWFSILRFRKKLVGAFSKPYQFIFFHSFTGFLMSVHMLYTLYEEGKLPPTPTGNFSPFLDLIPITTSPVCIFMGVFGHFATMATISWNMVITFQIVYILMGASFAAHGKKLSIGAHFYVWAFSLLTSTVPYFTGTYSVSSMGGCGIGAIHVTAKFLVFGAPLLLYLLLAIGISFSVYLHRNRVRQEYIYVHALGNPLEVAQYPEVSLLLSFTFAFIFCWIIPFILRLFESDLISVSDETLVWMSYVSLVSSGAQGLICSFIWGFSDFFRFLISKANRKTVDDPPLQEGWLDFIKTSVPKEMIAF